MASPGSDPARAATRGAGATLTLLTAAAMLAVLAGLGARDPGWREVFYGWGVTALTASPLAGLAVLGLAFLTRDRRMSAFALGGVLMVLVGVLVAR